MTSTMAKKSQAKPRIVSGVLICPTEEAVITDMLLEDVLVDGTAIVLCGDWFVACSCRGDGEICFVSGSSWGAVEPRSERQWCDGEI